MVSLSVIIPTHNRVNILKQALYHLNHGSVLPDEVIVVDDCSDPPVPSSINADDYGFDLKFIRFDENRGASCARNAGIRAGSKDVLLLMDDDIWPDHEMIRYHKYLHGKHFSGGYAVLGRVIFDPEMTRTPLLHFMEEYGPFRWLAKLEEGELYSTGILTANISIKRRFLDLDDLFDENFPFNRNEDTEFGLRQMNRGFEPRFHYAASARHHSPLTIEDNYTILTKSGYSKAYWMTRKPDDTRHCFAFEGLAGKSGRKEAFTRIYNRFIDEMGKEFFESDVSCSSPAEFEEFRAFYETVQDYVQSFGMISAFMETVTEFEQTFGDLKQGLVSRDTGKAFACYRRAIARNPDLFPLALLVGRKFKEAKKYQEAWKVLEPFGRYIWTRLELGELAYRMGKSQEGIKLLETVVADTGHGKAIEWEQRRIAAKWLLKLQPGSGSSDEIRSLLSNSYTDAEQETAGWFEELKAILGTDQFEITDEKHRERIRRLEKLSRIRSELEDLSGIRKERPHKLMKWAYELTRRFTGYSDKDFVRIFRSLNK